MRQSVRNPVRGPCDLVLSRPGRIWVTSRTRLDPTVTVAPGSNIERARTLHKPAHEKCFIANSVNFPVECEPEIVVAAKW